MIVPVVDAMYKPASYVVVFQSGAIGPDVPEYLGKYQKGSYANGYYRLKYDDTVILIQAETATQIGWAYHDAKTFTEGYIPVKRYGYWALFNEDGEEEDMEIPCGIASNGDLYEFYCERVLQFVEEKFPDNVETMKLLLQGYTRTEAAEELGVHRNTPRNQVNAMKEELTKVLDDLFSMFG